MIFGLEPSDKTATFQGQDIDFVRLEKFTFPDFLHGGHQTA